MTHQWRVGVMHSSRGGLALLIVVGTLLGGCASLPDTRGYTAATIQVRQAVATTGDIVEGELRLAMTAGATTATDESAKQLRAACAATVRSLDAMVAHAQSIEQIVDAGNKGAESAKQVADSVKQLVDAVKVDALTGASATVFQLSADTVAFVYGEYSKHVSAQSLEDALERFGPAIAKITGLVQAQLADARRLFVEQIEAQAQLLQTPAQRPEDASRRFGGWIKRHEELDEAAAHATQLLVRAMKDNRPEELAKAKAMLAHVETGQRVIAPRLAEYDAKRQALRQREKAGRSILGTAESAVAAWGAAHEQLAKAVKERRPVSVESLTAAVAEVRPLIQRWREL
jgi:hypothetical protein